MRQDIAFRAQIRFIIGIPALFLLPGSIIFWLITEKDKTSYLKKMLLSSPSIIFFSGCLLLTAGQTYEVYFVDYRPYQYKEELYEFLGYASFLYASVTALFLNEAGKKK